jgi:predicted phage terminase large subunit-like protein
MNPNDAYNLARQYLIPFAKTLWRDYLYPGHVVELAKHLEKVVRGEIKRLIITMPPRHSKSLHVGEFFPAWYFGLNPTQKIIYSTYSQELANNFGRKVRNHMLDKDFAKIFPDSTLAEDAKSKVNFSTKQGGDYFAVGRGSSVTGKGANLFLIDDALKDHKEAASPLIRQQLKDWYRAVAFTRLQKNAAIVVCGTRWHEDDLIGWLIREQADQNWTVLNMPARNESGKPLWPEMFSSCALEKIEATLGAYFWNALYMQRPSAAEGNIFKKDRWEFYHQLPPKFDVMIQSWDATFKETKKGSFVVGQVWGKKDADYYLIDQVRRRMGFTDTIKSIIVLSDSHPLSRKKLIEDKANGPAIIDVLKRKIEGITPWPVEGSKEARANAVSYIQESGNIYLPHPTLKSWVNDYIEEHAVFPNGDNDDQVDATTQALAHLSGGADAVARLQRLLQL